MSKNEDMPRWMRPYRDRYGRSTGTHKRRSGSPASKKRYPVI